jgi:hypothetical protein
VKISPDHETIKQMHAKMMLEEVPGFAEILARKNGSYMKAHRIFLCGPLIILLFFIISWTWDRIWVTWDCCLRALKSTFR